MATPAPERIDDLDLHLNPPQKPPLDFLASQELELQPEKPSGLHDFSGVKKPTEIDPVPGDLTLKHEFVKNSSQEKMEVEEKIFELPNGLISLINGLGIAESTKKALLHDLEDRHKGTVIKVLGIYYKKNYLTEGEYNKALNIIDEKSEEKPKSIDASSLVWPPPEEDVDDIETVDLWATRGGVDKKEDKILQTEEPENPVVSRSDANVEVENGSKEDEKLSVEETKQESEPLVEVAEKVKSPLDMARDNYARAKVEFNKKNSSYNKIKGSLQSLLSGGILSGRSKDKSPTEVELEEAQRSLEDAMATYIKEKATRKNEIIEMFEDEVQENERKGVFLTPEQEAETLGQIKIKLLEQAEREWDLLQEQIAGLSSVESEKINRIKEMTAKGLKVWSKVPMAARLAVAPILIGTGVGLTAGLGAGALYAGTRLGRGLGGAVGSRVAGSLYGKRADRINTEANEKIVSGYTDENSGKSFEEREMDYMNSKEEEAKRKKAQQIKKAMLMVGAGAGAGILTGLAESALSSGGTVSAASSVEATNKPKTGSFDGVVRPKSNISSVVESVPNKQESVVPEIVNKPENIIIPEAIKTPTSISATVELSSKGFLQDIHNLKANIIKQYGDNIPPEIKTNIIDKPTVEIAKEYGLYKPGSVNESAVGYAGEKLSLDGNGKLIIERLDGTKETLSGIGRGGVETLSQETSVKTSDISTAPEKLADVPVDTEVIQTKILEADSRMAPIEQAMVPEEPEIMPVVDTSRPENLINQIEHKGSLVDVVAEGEGRVVKIGDQIIGHDKVFGDSKILVLDDKFQDGAKNKDIREAFAVAFEKSAKVDQIGPNPTAVDFEGGKIYIIQGLKNDPMGMKVLLNGKEIASGSMEVRGSALGPKLKFDSSLKGGWFLDDNAYERAFKNVKKFLQIK